MAQTINHSRMTHEEAAAALALLETQMEQHQAACPDCAAQRLRTASGFAIWRVCLAGKTLLHTRLALEHRLHYLASRHSRRQAKTEREA